MGIFKLCSSLFRSREEYDQLRSSQDLYFTFRRISQQPCKDTSWQGVGFPKRNIRVQDIPTIRQITESLIGVWFRRRDEIQWRKVALYPHVAI